MSCYIRMVTQFDKAGNYTFALVATDAGGMNASVQDMNFIVAPRREFKFELAVLAARVDFGEGFTDPVDIVRWTAGSTYKMAPFQLDRKATNVSAGDFADIRYTLSEGAPTSFFVQSVKGVVFGDLLLMDVNKQFNFSLFAVDKAGLRAEIERFVFTVVPRLQFAASGTRESNGLSAHTFKEDYHTDFDYTVNETYKLAPFNTNLTLLNTKDDYTGISFLIDHAPTGVLIDVNTGYMQAQFVEAGKEYNISVLVSLSEIRKNLPTENLLEATDGLLRFL